MAQIVSLHCDWSYLFYGMLFFVGVCVWRFFNWAWLQPLRMELFLRRQGLKGNPYRFVVGDTEEIAEMYAKANSTTIGIADDITPRIMPFIEKTVTTYGTNAFAWIGPTARIIISEPELVKIVVNKHRIIQKNFKLASEIIRLVLCGLIFYEGDEWSKSRKKLNPAFNMEKLKQMVPLVQRCSDRILDQWKEKMDSKNGSGVVEVLHYLHDLSGSMTTEALFHVPFTDEMRLNLKYLRDITILASNESKPFSFPGSQFLPSKTKTKAKQMEKHVRESFMKIINQRIKDRKANSNTEEVEEDLLDLFLDELYHEPGKKLSAREEKRILEEAMAQCKVFSFAGLDTTSTLVVWTMISLAIHQDWQARAREEVISVVGDQKNLTSDILGRLKIVTMVLNEVLRLYPATMELSRVAEEDFQLGSLLIPKGVLVQIPIALLHRRTDIWGSDANEFRPERFADGVMKATNGYGAAAFMPFSFGPRVCIGQNFALLEAKVFVAQLLRTFTFELGPGYKHAPCADFMVHPQHGAPLLLRRIST